MASERLKHIVPALLLLVVAVLAAGDNSPAAWERAYRSAQSQLDSGEFDAALPSIQRGYEYWRTRPDSRWHWPFRLQLAEGLMELNRLDEASKLVASSAVPAEMRAQWLLDSAFLDYRQHNYQRASECLDRAETAGAGQVPALRARVDLTRGMIGYAQDRFDEAERSFRRSIATPEIAGTLMEVYALIDLGVNDLSQYRYDPAVFWFERARRAAAKLKSRRAEAIAAGNLGIAYQWTGDMSRALRLLNEAVSLSESMNDTTYALTWLVRLGEIHEAQRQFSEASRYYGRARALARPRVDDHGLIDILADLTTVALANGDLARAEALNADAFELARRLGETDALIPPRLNAARVAAARKDTGAAEALFAKSIASSREARNPTAQWEGHAGLGALYRESGRLDDADREYRAAIRVIEAERSKIGSDELRLPFLTTLMRFYHEYVDFLVERGQREAAFEIAASSKARVLAEKVGRPDVDVNGSLARMRRLVAEAGATLMVYWVASERSFVWVLDGSGLRMATLPRGDEIDSRVRSWRKAIVDGEDPMEVAEASGRWLAGNLVPEGLRPASGSRVIVVPDGSLYELNFETLPGRRSGGYWIEDATIAVAPSLALLELGKANGPGKLLLIGNPDYESREFPRLAGVKAEMKMVAKHFEHPDVFDASAATPSAYLRAAAGSYSTLHFAAHSVANRESPLDSAIVLSGPESDHKLYAREVIARPLRADLVTLSACQTAGSTTYAGEGLTGFAWAFLSSGARNVVAGLWDVDDRAATETMGRFYDALAAGEPPASALRSAKLSLMRSSPVYRKPLYWAAFETFTRALYRVPETRPPQKSARRAS